MPSFAKTALIVLVAAIGAGAWFTRHNNYSSNQAKPAPVDAEVARQRTENTEKLFREVAEREQQKKREYEEVLAFRNTNVDEYLKRLKPFDPVKWEEELKKLRPREYAVYQAERKAQSDADERKRQQASPADYLTLDNMIWRLGGFDTVMIVSFAVKSTLQFEVRDITVRCIGSGNSGTEIARVEKTIFDSIPAKATKRFTDVNMGFVSSQTSRARCEIVGVGR